MRLSGKHVIRGRVPIVQSGQRTAVFLTLLTVLLRIPVCLAGTNPCSLAANTLLVLPLRSVPSELTDITAPGDPVVGVPNDDDWPDNESPPLAIDDNVGTKYLHFKGETQATGIRVTPSTVGMIVGGLSFTTANDAEARDPIAYELYGSNVSINGPYTAETLIHSGEISDFKQATPWPRDTKNTTPIRFANGTVYAHYQLLITAVRNPGGANSMQVAEIELLGAPAGGLPPGVEAGEDRIVILPNTSVKLDGAVTYYGDHPEQLTMQWSVESTPPEAEPEEVLFEPNEFVEDPTVELPPVPGSYTLKLYATDVETEASDTVRIVVVESMCPVGNLNNDCAVSMPDVAIMADNWLIDSDSTGGTTGDINGKDGVNMADYSLLAANWKKEGPTVVINEFMAINNSKHPLESGELLDEEGHSSDWIELHNTTTLTISLKGWYLTNDPCDLTGWEFQGISLGPDEYLTVFASGKDRDDPDGELHTDFTLGGEAGYLALVKPDGTTVVHSYNYPQQFPSISYGLAASGGSTAATVELVAENADAYALIPQDESLGLSWTDPDFDHSGWKEGRTGVGYDYPGLIGLDVGEMRNVNRTAYIRIPFEISDLTGLRNLVLQMKYDDGFVAYLNDSVRLAGANDPSSPDWDSGAEFSHDDSQAVNFVDFPLPEEDLAHLRVGQNVLAIHGLNYLVGSSDLLIIPRLTAERVSGGNVLSSLAEGFFRDPSPGYGNTAGLANLGPAIRRVTENPPAPDQSSNLVVTAEISQTYDAVDTVTLTYRINFGTEIQIPMVDNGILPDILADDRVFTTAIPATAYSSGDMVRWCVAASDTAGTTTREPMFLDADGSPEYFGTIVTDPSINTKLPVFQYYVQNTSAAGTRTGTRASVYYLGEFYDNVFIRLRGANTTHGRKFEFNEGHHFRFDPGIPRVDEINLNERGAESTSLRQPLAWETYYNAQVPASLSALWHVRRNGGFHAVRIFVEQPDRDLLRRNNLDPDGALYKLYTDFRHGNIRGEQAPRKKTRLDEDLSDLQAFADGINPSNPNRFTYLFDNVNIPAVIQYWAASVLMHENDHTHKNYYGYRDTRDPANNPDGTNEWMYLPWDKDLTFGINNGIGGVIADEDWPGDVRSPSHPLYGSSEHQKVDRQWNGLIDALFDNQVTREMYLRRLRTLMDNLLQPPGTPAAQLRYENRIDQLVDLVDIELGGSNFYQEINRIKTQYLAVRRQHLYINHSINNPGYDQNAGIPDSQPTNPTITIGSIEYNPPSRNQDEEYIELVNPNAYAVDITGWRLDDAVEHTFPPGTVIPSGRSMYVTPDAFSFRNRSASPRGGQQRFVQGNYKGHLSSWGETIRLYNAAGELVDTLTYTGNPSDAQRYLRITEIMYHPTDADPEGPYNDEDYEYIELWNIGATSISLEGVKFTDGIDMNLPSISLSAGEYLLVAKNADALTSRYSVPTGVRIVGPYEGQLSNGGEEVKLEDITNSTILEFDYDDEWRPHTDGEGFSLTIIDPTHPEPNSWDEKDSWRASAYLGGSPGEDDSGILPNPGAIVINEIMAHSHALDPDWIELYNTTGDLIEIGGWYISDSAFELKKYRIADGETIGAYSYKLFYEDTHFGQFSSDPGRITGFAFSENGDEMYLSSASGGELMGYREYEDFGASPTGVSFGRYYKASTDNYNFVMMDSNTPGWENSDPKVTPIVINEIMYNPATGNQAEEYIELHNITSSPVTLYDSGESLPWKFTDGIDYTFPDYPGLTIAANGYVLIVKDVAAYMNAYGFPPPGVLLLGPYTGQLSNGGEKLELSMPGDEDEFGTRYYIRADRVNYSDGSHDNDAPGGIDLWPAEADAGGKSLARKVPSDYGNDPANWTAQDPSPGE